MRIKCTTYLYYEYYVLMTTQAIYFEMLSIMPGPCTFPAGGILEYIKQRDYAKRGVG